MDISPRKSLKRTTEPVDDWLHNEGYFRKHAPRDPTCLFRAVSEQVYWTQYYHIRVRNECVDFMRQNSSLFQQLISIPLESYLEQMSCFTEWGSNNEIQAMSLLYKREFVVFNGQKLVMRTVTNNGFKDTIYLCHTLLKQYDSVYAKDFIASAAFCQSLVYQTLYKDVFKMPNVENTVQKMLHDRTSHFRHDKFFLKGNLEMREQLTTQLMSKIEEGEDFEEDKVIARGNTPFPYRVAKALDANIYRNTDFDIWHEIRREVRNAGWTKWNGSELQVGGKCLVQVDFKDGELDVTNNNSSQVNGEKDGNGNTSKDSSKLGRREPAFLYGHIQEMSKDEGPVVVFIVELGEKRTLPFAAVKPLTPRRTKQNSWSPAISRKNTTYEPIPKWKNTWNSTARKSKELVSNTTYGMKNSVDKNNNNSEHNSDANTKANGKVERWDNESSDQKKSPGLKNYTMDTYNSCQGFPVENSIDVRPVTVILDNAHPTLPPSVPQHNEDYNKNQTQMAKNLGNNDIIDRASPNVGSLPPESLIPPLQQVSLQSPLETFYPSHLGMPPVFPGNSNMPSASPDGNSYPLPLSCFQVEPPAPGSLMDRTIRAINFSAASFDSNNSDLPDAVTLRFFYNYGLQCFRANYAVVYGSNGQPMVLGPNYGPQGNVLLPSTAGDVPQAAVPSEDDNFRGMNSSGRQTYVPGRRRNDHPSNTGKPNDGQQQQMTKTFNNRKNDMQESHGQRIDNSKNNLGDSNRPPSYPSARKNGPPSRYKKNMESQSRNRNMGPPPLYQQDHHQQQPQQQQQQQQQPQHQQHHHHQQQPPPGYQNNPVSIEPLMFQGAKNDSAPHAQPMPLMPPSSQSSTSGGNSAAFPPPYGPQTIYTPLPFYPNDGETFYAPGPGYYPVPYVGHPDLVEGNNVGPFPGQIYQSGVENYGQPMPAVYPPYMYPQQAIYPGLPPQVGQENWYPMPGQPQYMQYSQCPPSQSPPNQSVSPSP